MKPRYLFIYLLLIATSYNCTTVRVASNKATNYNHKLSKVFVITQSEAKASKVTATLSEKLMEAFKENEIHGRFELKSSLSIKTDTEYINKVKEYNPNQLMIIKQTAVNYRTPTIINAINFEINILDYTSNTIVWKGELEIYGQVGVDTSIERSINKLILKLRKDKLI